MNYYYATREGRFIDSSHKIDNPEYIQINEQQYHITRLIVRGYSRKEIESAVREVFAIIGDEQTEIKA